MRDVASDKLVIGKTLAARAERHPDAPAFYCSVTNRRFTFAEADSRTNRLAHALLKCGRVRGDVVAFLISNRAEIAEAYFAVARTGMIGLPLNYRLTDGELVELMRAMGATSLIYEARFAGAARRLQALLPDLAPIIRVGGNGDAIGLDYEALLAASSPEPLSIDVREEDPFYFNVTSGTTGAPKSYILTHKNNAVLAPVFDSFDLAGGDVAMTVFPMFGRVGFAWIAAAIRYGVPNVFANFEPAEVLRLIEAHGVTIVNMVPTMAAMLLPLQASQPRDLASLRAIVFAGANLPTSIREQSAAYLCREIYEFYGMNEMGALVVSKPADRLSRPHSVGRAIPSSEVRIVNEEGMDLGPNEVGEILGRSPMSAVEYFGDPERSAETFRNGWTHTGDLGSLDEAGYLFIRGRKKDVVISGGQNIYPAEVEDVILRHDAVAECAVFGVPDEFWGERVVSVVVLHPGAAVTPAQLDSHCRAHLAGFKVPKNFHFDGGPLPRTPTNKVQKFLLVARFSRKGRG